MMAAVATTIEKYQHLFSLHLSGDVSRDFFPFFIFIYIENALNVNFLNED